MLSATPPAGEDHGRDRAALPAVRLVVFRPFAMQHPEAAGALLEMMVQRVRDAENR